MLAYLEAGTVPTARFEHPTPARLLAIQARAEHWIDWGDGSALDGPFDHPGGPLANGMITLLEPASGGTTCGWSSDGRAAGRSAASAGADGLVTEGVIEDFRVESSRLSSIAENNVGPHTSTGGVAGAGQYRGARCPTSL